MFIIEDAFENNLRHISVKLPKYKFIVMTGPSGSGKSSFAFDTLYMEGRRKFLDSLSLYARQFVGEIRKPKVRHISGLTPTIAINQATATTNPRSTVGTITEVYDYMRVLWGRAGIQHCPKCGCEVVAASVDSICERFRELPAGTRCILYAPQVQQRKGQFEPLLEKMRKAGFTKVRIDGETCDLTEGLSLTKTVRHTIDLLIDRIIIKPSAAQRIRESIELALFWGKGQCHLDILDENKEPRQTLHFSQKAACSSCGQFFPEVTPNALAFNSPAGMCPSCEGIGTTTHIDPVLCLGSEDCSILPDDIGESVLLPLALNTEKEDLVDLKIFKAVLMALGIDLTMPWKTLPESQRQTVLYGSDTPVEITRKGKGRNTKRVVYFNGFLRDLEALWASTGKESLKQYLSAFMVETPCPACHGHRLKEASQAVVFAGKRIAEVHDMTVVEATQFFENIKLTKHESLIAKDVIPAIISRLHFIQDVGVGYLQLSRSGPTLSGGEAQRIRLATLLGSGLTAVTYILDEPSIGLHARDQDRLIGVLQKLRDQGNSVIVVEHDEATMRAADYIVDFGPGSGTFGGEIVFDGSVSDLGKAEHSITADYLLGRKTMPLPNFRRPGQHFVEIHGAKLNNLKNIDVRFPTGTLTCITGVSGSGKSTLINDILLPALNRHLHRLPPLPLTYETISGLDDFQRVIEVDQKPIGRTPRSNPATYTKVFDIIRQFFAVLPESQMYGYGPGRFSFNVSGENAGRCEVCQGAGVRTIEMRFLSNSYIPCEACGSKRFNEATLRVRYKGLSISDILNLSFTDALEVFSEHPKITRILQTVVDVGLGYLTLGQPSPTLSGGESQRIKLSREIARPRGAKTLYVLDEPSTGLHFEDIRQLLIVLQNLVDKGNTVLVIEHNLDIIQCADYIIDLGPEGGAAGGEVLAMGTPEDIASCKRSHTGKYLRDRLF